jgi:hypothetical protein
VLEEFLRTPQGFLLRTDLRAGQGASKPRSLSPSPRQRRSALRSSRCWNSMGPDQAVRVWKDGKLADGSREQFLLLLLE